MYLICPPKFCISFVFNFSWDGCNTQEKWKTKVRQNFFLGRWGGGGTNQVHYGRRCGSGVWTFGIRIINIAWKAWIFPSSDSPQIALEWCLELSTEMSTWVVALSWLGWQNAAICMKLSIQAWWSSLIVSVYRSGMLALVQPPLPSEKKKSIFVLHTGYGMGRVYFPFHRKIKKKKLKKKFWCLLCYAEKSLAISSRILERCFLRFYCPCRFLTVQNSFWTVAF